MNLAPTKEWCQKMRRAFDEEMKALVLRGGTVDPDKVAAFEEKMAAAEAEAQELAEANAASGLQMSAELVAAAVKAVFAAQKAEKEAEEAEAAKAKSPRKTAAKQNPAS